MLYLLLLIYLAFISLGLPDALLGSAWPVMSQQFCVPMSYMGLVSLLISGFTVVSSLLSDRLNGRFGTGKVTAFSVGLTAVALVGFALTDRYWMLCIWAIPYGLGAGSVDAALNNYVANHYASRHMSWLHCMWGLGAAIGPYVMGAVLSGGQTWNMGYVYIGIFQFALTATLMLSIPKWKKTDGEGVKGQTHLSLKEVIKIPGVKEALLIFLCYSAIESIGGHWASSYLAFHLGMTEEKAAALAAMFYLGITAGRAVSGFATYRLNDRQMSYVGMGTTITGILLMLLSKNQTVTVIGFTVAGFGCAPIFPCIIHNTPNLFGADRSQSVIGVQMASFYAGTCLFPPLFGVLADWVGIGCMPAVLLLTLCLMLVLYIRFCRLCDGNGQQNNGCK